MKARVRGVVASLVLMALLGACGGQDVAGEGAGTEDPEGPGDGATEETDDEGEDTDDGPIDAGDFDAEEGGATGEENTYKIGAVLALTGDYSGTDQDSAAGLRATVAELNELGGVNGRMLEYTIIDNQSDPDKASLGAQMLLDRYQPDVMIPDIPCFLALSALAVAGRGGINTFTGCDNGEPSNPELFPHNFSTFPPSGTLGLAMVGAAEAVLGDDPMSIGFLHTNDASGTSLVEPMREAAEGAGHTWTEAMAFAVGEPDMSVQLSRLREAGADVVLFWGHVGDAGSTMRSMRDLAWDAHVIGGTGTTSENLLDEIPPELMGNFHALTTALSIREEGSEEVPEWIDTYLREASDSVQTLSVVGAVHDGLHYWKWAVERTGSTDPEAVTAELETLGSVPEDEWPPGLHLANNPQYASDQHGLLYANLNDAWGVMTPSRNIMGTYEGRRFTCECTLSR